MLYTAAEIIVFLITSAAIGVLVGYFTWGRKTADDSTEVTMLQRQLAATRKRAAAAESDAVKRGEALAEAKLHFEAQQSRITQLASEPPPPPAIPSAPEDQKDPEDPED